MTRLHPDSWHSGDKCLNVRFIGLLVIRLWILLLANIQAARSVPLSSVRCKICAGSYIPVPCETHLRYENFFQVENHLYFSTSTTEISFYPGHKHLKCTVAEIFIYNQILLKLSDQQWSESVFINLELRNELVSLGEVLNLRIQLGVSHLARLLINLYKNENISIEEGQQLNIHERFGEIDKLRLESTLNYLFSSMGGLNFAICNKLLEFIVEWRPEHIRNIWNYLERALAIAKTCEITAQNRVSLEVVFAMHDTFFLPLLFSPTKFVEIYPVENLIDFIMKGDCFLRNWKLRESSVFRNIFLACLINSIKKSNTEISEYPQRFLELCKNIREEETLKWPNRSKSVEEFIKQISNIYDSIIRQPNKILDFCVDKDTLIKILCSIENGLVQIQNGKSIKVIKDRFVTRTNYTSRKQGRTPMVYNPYCFKFLVLFIWKYIDFTSHVSICTRNYCTYFDKYAINVLDPLDESAYNHRTSLSYMLINYIFSMNHIRFDWHKLETISKFDINGQAYSIYMVTNYASIVSTLKNNSFHCFYDYIQRIKVSGRVLPMYSHTTSQS